MAQTSTVAERLGKVLHWGFCALATAALGIGILLAFAVQSRSDMWFMAACGGIAAMVLWAVGRGCRYVLSGY